MSRSGYLLAILASSVLGTACTDDQEPANQPPAGSTSGDESTTFDHDNNTISPWDLLERLQAEGPPTFTSHVHSCAKVRYATLGTVLKQLGVDMTNTTALSAADLYNNGFNALGGANYANRIRENISISTSGASREFDIFAAASDEIINGFTNQTAAITGRCGAGVQLFNADNTCRPDGLTCLMGTPATTSHIDFCNITVQMASDVTVGKRLAVASVLAAAYTCE